VANSREGALTHGTQPRGSVDHAAASLLVRI
jgi:hypothetical protein